MPQEFRIKNGVIVDQGGANITGSSFISGSLAINASGSSVFTVDGTAGRLFSVDDSLTGSLFSVNTVAGLPVIEAFSDNTVRVGQYGKQALFVSQSKVGIGKENALNGILDVSGSVTITGSITATNFTGSLFGTASWAQNATTSSYVLNAISSSFASTASNVLGGTTNYLARWTSATTLGIGVAYDNGTNVGIGTTSPATLFYVNGYTPSNWITTFNNTGSSGHQMYFGYNDGSTTRYGLYIAGGPGTGVSSFDLAVDGKFYVTSGGNVGIGTTSPETLLHINKSTEAGEGGYLYLDNPATSTLGNKSGIKFGTSNGASFASVPTGEITNVVTSAGSGASALTFGTFNGSSSGERMRLDAIGNLGLGVTPSAWSSLWSAQQFGQAGSLFAYKSDSNYTVISNNSYAVGGSFQVGDARYINNGFSTAYAQNNSGEHLWLTAPSGTAGGTITHTQAMTLNASGQLGIGTTSPSEKLHVVGNGLFTSNIQLTGDGYVYGNSTASSATIRAGIRFNSTNQELKFFTADLGRMTLDSSGNLGLGVTPSAWGSGSQAIENSTFAISIYGYTRNAFYNGSSWRYVSTDFASRYTQFNSEHLWYNAPSGTAGNVITFTQAMTLNAGGRLLVGTTSDDGGNRLQVNGGIISSVATGFTALITLKSGNGESYISETDGTLNMVFVNKSTIDLGANVSDIRFCTNNNTTTPALILALSGAATFSSSVTANSLVIKNGGVPAAQFFRDLDVTVVGPAGQGIEFGARNGASTYVAGAAIYGTLFNPATDGSLIFQTLTAGTLSEKMRITSGGNVSIGNTNNTFKLDVSGTGRFTERLQVRGGGAGTSQGGILIDYVSNANSRSWILNNDYNVFGDFAILQSTTQTGSTYTAPFYIKNDGNIGIGTTSPSQKLHIMSGSVLAEGGGTNNGVIIGSHTNNVGGAIYGKGITNQIMYFDSTNTILNGESNIYFRIANSDKVTINSSGNVGIGTTSPTYKLEVHGSSDDLYIAAVGSAPSLNLLDASSGPTIAGTIGLATGTNNFIQNSVPGDLCISTRGSTNASAYIMFGSGSTMTAYISGSGDMYIAGTLTQGSTRNIKENIVPISNALSIVTQIQGVTYNKKDGSATNEPGFIAEDMYSILPSLVSLDRAGDPQGIKYTNLTAYLLEAIKELKVEIDILKNET